MIHNVRWYSHLFAMFLLLLFGSTVAAQQPNVTAQDAEFVKRATVANMLEIQLGQLALKSA